MRKCPYCAEEINDTASWCRFCWSKVTPQQPSGPTESSKYSVDPGGRRATWQPDRPTAPREPARSVRWTPPRVSLSPLGTALILVGMIASLYFYAGFKTVVPAQTKVSSPYIVGTVQVQDSRLMGQRRVGIIAGIAVMVLGLVAGLSWEPGQPRERAADPAAPSFRPGRLRADPRYLPEDPE